MTDTRSCDICHKDMEILKYIVKDDLYICYSCEKNFNHKTLAKDFTDFLRENEFDFHIASNGDIIVEIRTDDREALDDFEKVIVDKFFDLLLKYNIINDYDYFNYVHSSRSVFKINDDYSLSYSLTLAFSI